MPMMGMLRGERVHLSERIDLMANVTSIGFVVPTLDKRNVGVNVAGGEGDNVSNAAVVGACAARVAENVRVMALVEHPNWNRVKRVQWRARVGSKASEHCKSTQGWTMRVKMMALLERSNWNRLKRVQWRARVGSKATECCESVQGRTIIMSPSRGVVTKVN
jgi:hypothetical protein